MLWSKEKIVQRIHWTIDHYGTINPQQFSQVYSVLEKYDRAEVFEILYGVLTSLDSPMTYGVQEFVGRLLFLLQPPCTLGLKEAIRGLLKCYNLSIEELPWYFAEQYGKVAVLEALEHLESELLSDQEQRSISTWKWWLIPSKSDVLNHKYGV